MSTPVVDYSTLETALAVWRRSNPWAGGLDFVELPASSQSEILELALGAHARSGNK